MLQRFNLRAAELCFDFYLVTAYEVTPSRALIAFAFYWLLREPITVRYPLPTIIGEVRRGNWLRRVRDPRTRRKLRRALTFAATRAGLLNPVGGYFFSSFSSW